MMPEALRSRVAALARLDKEWRIAAASPAFCALLGRSRAEIVGRPFLDFAEATTSLTAALLGAELLDADGAVTRDFRIIKPAGENIWVRGRILLSAAEDGAPFPNEISLTEIEDLRQFSSEQARQVAVLDRVLSVVDSVFWVSRLADGKNLYVSPTYEQIWGARCNELKIDGTSWLEAVHPDDRSRVQAEINRQRAAKQPFNVEYRLIGADGVMRWIWARGTPARDVFGNVDVYIGSSQDITERKQHEIELARLQAADNVNAMAADLAHNFNNLLAIIDLAAHAIERTDHSGTHADKLESIHSAVERGSEITRLLLSISSRQMLTPSHVDLNSAVNEIKPLVAATIGLDHQVIYDLTSHPCPVHIDRTGLNQALLNLIKNSREAMPGGGELLIMTRVLPSAVISEDGETEQPCAQISIEDNGTGMSEHALRHATDPYFTTKSDGSGFGLAITNGFVRQSGGRLFLENKIGGGLIARMVFPLAPNAAGQGRLADDRGAMPAPCLLVVDDEPAIANEVSQLLEAEGYLVATATTMRGAKRQLDAEPFAAVISDVALGAKSTGVDLALWIRERHPAVKLVLMSGYTSDRTSVPGDIPFITKPFAPGDLVRIVRSVLDRKP